MTIAQLSGNLPSLGELQTWCAEPTRGEAWMCYGPGKFSVCLWSEGA